MDGSRYAARRMLQMDANFVRTLSHAWRDGRSALHEHRGLTQSPLPPPQVDFGLLARQAILARRMLRRGRSQVQRQTMRNRNPTILPPGASTTDAWEVREEGWHVAVYTQNVHKRGPFPVARLETDLPFHKRLAYAGEVPALLSQLRTMRSEEAVPN